VLRRLTTDFELPLRLELTKVTTEKMMSTREPDPPDDRPDPGGETTAIEVDPTTATEEAEWNQVRRRSVKILHGHSATFNPRSVASIPQRGKKRLSPDEARSLVATLKKASKLTVQGESEEAVESLLLKAAAIGRQAPTLTGKATPAPASPMDTGSSSSDAINSTPVVPLKRRQIPAITGFFPESFNHLSFARKLTGKLNCPPILSRRGTDKRGPPGSLEVKVRVSIQTTSESDYHTTTHFLKAEGIEFFVFRTLSDRTVKVVVRNLMELTPTEEIQAELVSLGYEVVNVAAMRNFRKEPIPIFLVELRDCPSTPEIYNLRTLLHMRVKVEAYRGPSGPRQCHNCCRFGHVTSGCNALPRCVKCAGAHHTNTCQLKDHSIPATCANCNEQHTASYRACRAFRAAAKAHKTRLQPTQPKPQPEPPVKFMPAPVPAHNAWDRVNTSQATPTSQPIAEPIPVAKEAPVVKPAAAKQPSAPVRPKVNSALPPKPQREKAISKPISNQTPNTSFLRNVESAASAPSENQPPLTDVSSLIKRGLELLQMKLHSTSTTDSQALAMATLRFVIEAVQMLV
jgi:hypothetical protein